MIIFYPFLHIHSLYDKYTFLLNNLTGLFCDVFPPIKTISILAKLYINMFCIHMFNYQLPNHSNQSQTVHID